MGLRWLAGVSWRRYTARSVHRLSWGLTRGALPLGIPQWKVCPLPERRRWLELTRLADPRVLSDVSVDGGLAAVLPPYLTFGKLVVLKEAGEPAIPQCRIMFVSGRADQVGEPVEGVNRQMPAGVNWAGARG